MQTMRRLLGVGLAATLLLCSCEDPQDSRAGQGQLGPTKEGAPLSPGTQDPGILEDATTYQPAKVPGSLAPGGAKSGGKEAKPATGDADSAVRALVESLTKALEKGDVEQVLKLFNEEQVAALAVGDKFSPILGTFERTERLAKKLAGTSSQPAESSFKFASMGDVTPKWEILDPEHAVVTPNLAAAIFGPSATPTLTAAKGPQGWKFQLKAALTAADVEAILAVHKQIQEQLDQMLESIESGKAPDFAAMMESMMKAMAGQLGEALGGAVKEPNAAEPAKEPNEPSAAREPNEPKGAKEPSEPNEPNEPNAAAPGDKPGDGGGDPNQP